jgi:hypothetical protein
MSSDVIIKVVCSPSWDIAAANAWLATIERLHTTLVDKHWLNKLLSMKDHAKSRSACAQMADDLRAHADLAICWNLLAVDPQRPAAMLDSLRNIYDAVSGADANVWPQLFPRLAVMREIARGLHIDEFGSIFHITSMRWLEHKNASAIDSVDGHAAEERPSTSVAVQLLLADSWDSAHAELIAATEMRFEREGQHMPDRLRDRTVERTAMRAMIQLFSDDLLARGAEWAGDLAIAWRMLACHPALPGSFNEVLPPLQQLFNRTIFYSSHDATTVHERLDVWWRAADGRFPDCKDSMFELAFVQHEFAGRTFFGDDDDNDPAAEAPSFLKQAAIAANRRKSQPQRPSVIVMPGAHAEERGLPQAWRDLRDQALPLVVARDVHLTRAALVREFPHAEQAITLLTRDLREHQPVRMQPMILVGEPGGGKSRLVRKLADRVGIYVYRYDGASATDGMFGGTPKAWSNAQPSAPARAIMMSQTANPIVMVDEIEKAGSSSYNGNLWSSMTPFLERETASRYRDGGIDAELDLSHVSHIATANALEPLPGPLRDRFRIVRIPRPTLAHLPALVEQVMLDLASDDDARRFDDPLASDELEIIGRAWAREKFSMRRLQRIVAATLEARDYFAPRH